MGYHKSMAQIIQIFVGHKYGRVAGPELCGTENPNSVEKIQGICEKYFDGFTLNGGLGVWEGVAENCTIITIVDVTSGDDGFIKSKLKLAEELKKMLKQDSILVTKVDAVVKFI